MSAPNPEQTLLTQFLGREMGSLHRRIAMSCLVAMAAGWFGSDVLAAPLVSVLSGRQSLAWLLSPDEANAALVLKDPRFRALLSSKVPQINLYLGMSPSKTTPPPLIYAVQAVMGGLGQSLTVKDGRYVMLSACRLHSCDEKGFVWIDTAQSVVIGGVVHYFFGSDAGRSLLIWSGQQQAVTLPGQFLRDFDEWNSQWKDRAKEAEQEVAPSVPLRENGYVKVRLVAPDGRILSLTSDLRPLTAIGDQ